MTVKKAEEKAARGSLLAKLHYGVLQFLDEAELFMKGSRVDLNVTTEKLKVSRVSRVKSQITRMELSSPSLAPSGHYYFPASCEVLTVEFSLQKFVRIASVLHESRSQRYIAAEYTKIERFGVAVGVLRYSLKRVLSLRPGNFPNFEPC